MIKPYTVHHLVNRTTPHILPIQREDPAQVIQKLSPLFDSMDSLASTFFFLYDFVNSKYLKVSKSIKSLIGLEAEELIQKGCTKAMEFCHPDDLEQLGQIHEEIFRFTYTQPIEKRANLRFDFTYRMKTPNGSYKCFLQQSQFIALTEGKPMYDFGSVTDISSQELRFKTELLVLHKCDISGFQPIHHFGFAQENAYGLSRTEIKILHLASQGLTSKEIACKVSRSLHTINNHRKNIIQKTKTRSFYHAMVKTEFLTILE